MTTLVDLKMQEEVVRSLDYKVTLRKALNDALSSLFGSKEPAAAPKSVGALAAIIQEAGGSVG